MLNITKRAMYILQILLIAGIVCFIYDDEIEEIEAECQIVD